MSERFIKFIPSKEAMFLVTHKNPAYQNAFRLLTIIAERARRYNGHPDGLTVGQCHLGKWTDYGMSEQNYKTAKKILERMGQIKIVETNRTRQKQLTVRNTFNSHFSKNPTTGVTTEGTLVELISSMIYDINSDEGNDRSNDQLTTDQRLPNDKLRKNKKEKKEKEEQPLTPSLPSLSKIKFRDLVELTQAEYDSLLAKNGLDFLNLMLDALDSYKGSSGKKYDSDFHTMKQGGWVVNRVKKDLQTQKSDNEKPYKPSQKAQSSGDIQPSGTKFQPGRVLRGSNDQSDGSVDKRGSSE